ncbi:MAG TPA: flagellar hook-basal body complex protein [Fibrobacteria bacterium]|nr:flagellar hook-basal body complex protein [Fibrobacteria bacterium]
MLRSLYASISGLRNHQTRMDVIGNNIANVNTTGYKSSRVTFEESLSQMLQGASRGIEGGGGTNPMQVGLGMNVGSIDSRMSQGNLESTGLITDLSIEGKAYFAVSDGNGTYFTRNGAFQFDSGGQMVLPTNGMVLQGKLADNDGSFTTQSLIGNIRIPFNDQAPAKATTEVNFARNLDSESLAKGSILYTQKFMHHAEAGDSLLGLNDHAGVPLDIQPGDVLTYSVTVGGTASTKNFTVTDTTTLQNLADDMSNWLRSGGPNAGVGTTVAVVTNAESPTQRGALTIFGNSNPAGINNFQVTSSRPISGPKVTKAFAMPTTIPAGTTRLAVVSDTLRSPAADADPLSELFDASGTGLGLEPGDQISVIGSVGGTAANNVTPLTYVAGAGGTKMSDILAKIKDNFKLPDRDGTVQNNLSVSLNAAGSDDNIADGSIVVRGQPETAFALRDMTIRATDANNAKPTPSFFNTNMNSTTLRDATDTAVSESSITIYDKIGKEHTATMRFIPTNQPGQWLWEMKLSGQESIVKGQKGKMSFGQDGSVSSFTFDDGSSTLEFDPRNGAPDVELHLGVGGPRDFTGLTQFRSATTATAVGQDGYTMGRLRSISIGEDGIVAGSFTNGTTKNLAQIMVADFTNPGGLQKVKDSVYTTSSNSGDPIYGAAGASSSSVIKPGSLELSNVELAQEFTDMITTQRGYQANARVITVSDSLLEELVNLKR